MTHATTPDFAPLSRAGRRRFPVDPALALLCRSAASVVLLMLGSLIVVLTIASIPAMREFGLGFAASGEWRANALEVPRRDAAGGIVFDDGEMAMDVLPPTFGALPVIWGTAASSLIALVFAVPLSLGTAIFLVRIAPRWLVAPVSFLVEFLAAIPSIAYGIWGLFVLAPLLQAHVEPALFRLLGDVPGLGWLFYQSVTVGETTVLRPIPMTGRDLLCGGLILAIMILPIITAISRDVLAQVPRAQVEGAVALGANWWQSSREMLAYGRSALFGAVMLGLARAAGETMAVTMVIGNNNQIVPSPFAPAQTMASLLANEFAEASGGMHRSALCFVALILLLMSLVFNVVARRLVVGSGLNAAAAH